MLKQQLTQVSKNTSKVLKAKNIYVPAETIARGLQKHPALQGTPEQVGARLIAIGQQQSEQRASSSAAPRSMVDHLAAGIDWVLNTTLNVLIPQVGAMEATLSSEMPRKPEPLLWQAALDARVPKLSGTQRDRFYAQQGGDGYYVAEPEQVVREMDFCYRMGVHAVDGIKFGAELANEGLSDPMLSKVLSKVDLSSTQASERDWTPLYQKHKSAVVKTPTGIDSIGRRYYKDAKTGLSSKSALQRRDEVANQRAQGDFKFKSYILEPKSMLWFRDFCRFFKSEGPNQASIGITPYVETRASIDNAIDGHGVAGHRAELAVQGGINLVTVRLEHKKLTLKADLDAPHFQGSLDTQMQTTLKDFLSPRQEINAGRDLRWDPVSLRITGEVGGLPNPNFLGGNFLPKYKCKLEVNVSMGSSSDTVKAGYGDITGTTGKRRQNIQAGRKTKGKMLIPEVTGSGLTCEPEKVEKFKP